MTVSNPRTSVTIARDPNLVPSQQHRVLAVGQKTSTGTAVSGDLIETFNGTDAEIDALFGARSNMAQIIRAFKEINSLSALDVIPISDAGSGVSATSTVGFAGTATENGTLLIDAVSLKDGRYSIDVLTGETAGDLANKLTAAVTARARVPYTAVTSTNDVNMTAANAGTAANDWLLAVSGTVTGITVSLTGWASGATDPTLTNVLNVTGNKRYNTVIWQNAYGTAEIKAFLDARFNVFNDVLDGVAILTVPGTAVTIKAVAAALNSQSFAVFADKAVSSTAFIGTGLRESGEVVSARIAAARSARLTDESSLANLLTTPAGLDQFGGVALSTLPYHNTVISGLFAPRTSDDWTTAEVIDFEQNGVSVAAGNRAGSSVILGQVVTTNTTDEASNPNTSFKFLNTVDAASAIRETFFLRLQARYAQSRLTDGDLIAGRDMANESEIRGFLKQVYQELADLAITQAGAEAIQDFERNAVVLVVVSTGTVSITIAPLLVGQIRVILATMTVNLGS